MTRLGAGLLGALLPAVAEACATCISTPFGDRTYNWPYLALILMPFVLTAVIGGVIAHVTGVGPAALWRRLARRFHPTARQEGFGVRRHTGAPAARRAPCSKETT